MNAEHFFRILSPDRATDIFIRQAKFIRTLFSAGCFTFNIPARALMSAPLLKLTEAELIPEFIIEIQDPETIMSMTDSERELLISHIPEIKKRGSDVWLDDVTPEMTDFFLALNFPVDGVKTDRSALHRTADEEGGLKHFIEKCAQLAPLVVVEGIETVQMKCRAQDAGALGGQGFLWPGKTFLYPY
ncbi:EAL domain-containing protein [Citrobacter meridianamericanus]|uniref:EAL domain-containing protein n=1 Tax=Citrobacter meridianamericanus TaxID=2894201 RepID=A0ABT1BFH3_9ENTR|nr:EAL domain-containing protein [Citrobacter meridianamericanus]